MAPRTLRGAAGPGRPPGGPDRIGRRAARYLMWIPEMARLITSR